MPLLCQSLSDKQGYPSAQNAFLERSSVEKENNKKKKPKVNYILVYVTVSYGYCSY